MAKRRRRRRVRARPRSARRPQPAPQLERSLVQAQSLIERGRPQEAIDLLEPLLKSYPRVGELHYHLGFARFSAGDPWSALTSYEQAVQLSHDPVYWLPLASLYLDLELHEHALHAFREMFRQQVEIPKVDEARQIVASLEQDMIETAHHLDIPVGQVEKGFRHLEEGQHALHAGDFPACIAANRRAVKLLSNWPPPYNNLSIALFFNGQPAEAIAAAREVLSYSPENIQALSNAIRFLAWTGQESEAWQLWARLREITPDAESDRQKKAEAAAILGEDESVYELLKPLDKGRAKVLPRLQQARLFLAVAEANTNRRRDARRRLEALRDVVPWAEDLLTALKAGQTGPGWAERFPYFHSSELITRQGMETFVQLVTRQDEMSSRQFRRELERILARFPQIVRVAEKLIREENQPDAGMSILAVAATPAAYAALRRFGLSQAGDDETRMQALFTLAQAGQIAEDETLRVWSDGEWREIQLRQYEISEEEERPYSPEVAGLLNEGLAAFKRNDLKRAERLLQRAIALEPRAKEGYNNLAALYDQRGDQERAKEMFRAALEIDPTYVFPRANLALYLLDEDDVEGAEEMLAPLADVTRFRPQEMAFYSYIQARLSLHHEEYEAARQTLEAALQILPGYEPAEGLLEHLEFVTPIRSGWESFARRQRERDQAKRARLQARLTTPNPSLSKTLPLYTKDALTGMARVVIPWGGWTALRKAELVERIISVLEDRDLLEGIVARLDDDERDALRQVLERGSSMPWEEFDAGYGNDLEESAYWQSHEPATLMGRLRLRGLLAEATVDGQLLMVVPSELRRPLEEILG
ncbi:MAG: tetratricopeptide repeat protein [Anaerolineae bacterium]